MYNKIGFYNKIILLWCFYFVQNVNSLFIYEKSMNYWFLLFLSFCYGFCYSFCYGFSSIGGSALVRIVPSAKASALMCNALHILITLPTLELLIPLLKILSNVVYGISARIANSRTLWYLVKINSFNSFSTFINYTSQL